MSVQVGSDAEKSEGVSVPAAGQGGIGGELDHDGGADVGEVDGAAAEVAGADLDRPRMVAGRDRLEQPGEVSRLGGGEWPGASDDDQDTGSGVAPGDHRVGPLGRTDDRTHDGVDAGPGFDLDQPRTPGRYGEPAPFATRPSTPVAAGYSANQSAAIAGSVV